MKVITISREFGSGGRELGKRLADGLGFDYYDKEIIAAIAQGQGLDENYVEKALEHHIWKSVPLAFGRSFTGAVALQSAQTGLLLEQKRVIERIAEAGKDCVIVGRNADMILEAVQPFSIFVCERSAAARSGPPKGKAFPAGRWNRTSGISIKTGPVPAK